MGYRVCKVGKVSAGSEGSDVVRGSSGGREVKTLQGFLNVLKVFLFFLRGFKEFRGSLNCF